MEVGKIPLTSSIYFKNFILNLFLMLLTISICFFAAEAILPSISRETSKTITDAAVNRLLLQSISISNELDELSSSIQTNPVFFTSNINDINTELEKMVNYSSLIDDILVLTPKGIAVSVHPDPNHTLTGQDFSQRDYFQKILQSNSIYYSDIFTAQTGQAVIVVGVPLLNEQNLMKKIVILRIRLAENNMIDSMFRNFDIGGSGYMYMVDRRGKIFYHPDKQRIGGDGLDNPVVQELTNGRSGYLQITNPKDVQMYASYKHIPQLGWGVVAQIPVESTYYSLERLKDKIWNYMSIFILPMILLLILYTRKVTRPLKRLYEGVNEVAKGNYDHYIRTNDQSEIGIISKRFNEMIEYLRMNRENLQSNERELLEQQSYLSQIMDTNPNFIYARDQGGNYTLVNKTRAEYFGKPVEEILGRNEKEINPNLQEGVDSLHTDWQIFQTKTGIFIPEYHITDSFGETRTMQIYKMPVFNADREVEQVLCVANDITELKQKEKQIQYQAFHDSLTGLPNRDYFKKQTAEVINLAQPDQKMSLLFLDLDHFKDINDSLGHAAGDELIKMIAEILKHCVAEPNMIARMGGDEFTILLKEQGQDPAKMAEQIIEALKEPFMIENREFHITTSIGISLYPQDGSDVDVLLKHADLAMYQAKRNGKDTYQLFNRQMSREIWERLTIAASMRRALEQEEFYIVYQPKYNIQRNKISGIEALLRWDCPHLGIIPPDKFIPIAEETGFIIPLGEWVLRESCIQNKKWQQEGYAPMRVAVNISARQLIDPYFLKVLEQALEDTSLDPEWLELEITESTFMQCSEDVLKILNQLSEMKIHLSIDDFGTGYSSLSYLKQFPVHSLKIDRSFVQELDENNQSIIRAVIAICKSLRLSVTAEGVEETHQVDFLRREMCDEIQGYHISKPIREDEFKKFLRIEHQVDNGRVKDHYLV